MKNWNYSLLMIPLYMGTFLFWALFPSRAAYVIGALVTATAMGALIRQARRQSYFTNRVDFFLHIYVVIDILLEGFVFELLLLSRDWFGFLSNEEAEQLIQTATSFHDNNHFYGCTAFFVIAIGLNRWFGLRRRDSQSHPPEGEQEPGASRT